MCIRDSQNIELKPIPLIENPQMPVEEAKPGDAEAAKPDEAAIGERPRTLSAGTSKRLQELEKLLREAPAIGKAAKTANLTMR